MGPARTTHAGILCHALGAGSAGPRDRSDAGGQPANHPHPWRTSAGPWIGTPACWPGGADFQAIVTPTLARLDARYLLETEAGELIYVCNRAVRTAAPEVTARLVRGEPVDPAQVYFRCVPTFETSAPGFAWINERVFVGSGVRRPDRVEISCFNVL